MEFGRPGGTWLAYQFDYRPIHIGIYYWCLGVNLQEALAARATFLMFDNDDCPEAIANIKALAVQNPTRLAAKMQDHFGDAGPETSAWCEDLILLGRQIAADKQLQWLRHSGAMKQQEKLSEQRTVRAQP